MKKRSEVKRLMYSDYQVFWELYDNCYDRFLRYAFHTLKSIVLAESVLERCFSKLWYKRQLLKLDASLEDQLLEMVRRWVLKVLPKRRANTVPREKIWECIERREDKAIHRLSANQENYSLVKLIHNGTLQRQLLHKLATSCR